jgi:general secretion pathway protein B
MSYILEALRRAEAERERERGTVPGLHAQARHMPEHDDEPAAARGPAALTWAAVALAAVALVGAGWWFLAPKAEPPPVLAAAPVPAPVPAPVLPASPVVAAPAAPPAAAAPRETSPARPLCR